VTCTNTTLLARILFELGIELRRVVVCPDEVDTIGKDLSELRATHDFVFTSGGVGPTHDDVTIDGVAESFGRPVVRSVATEKMIRDYHGDRTTEAHLRMASLRTSASASTKATSSTPKPSTPSATKAKSQACWNKLPNTSLASWSAATSSGKRKTTARS
jgi:molybdopterin-biosynthesis enzyme MoeA-like protein